MDTRPPVDITLAKSAEQLEASRTLFREYAAQLGVDLGFQGFEDELAALPDDYGAPRGALLLASVDGELAGCCALRPIDDADYPNAAEMKRLFVRKAFRGFGLGRLLDQRGLEPLLVRGRAGEHPAEVERPHTQAQRPQPHPGRDQSVAGPEPAALDGLQGGGAQRLVVGLDRDRHRDQRAELIGAGDLHLKTNFTILDTDDQIRLMKQLILAENLDEKRWPARQLAHLIDGWKNRCLTPARLPKGEELDDFWERKQRGEAWPKPARYSDIHMPRNTGTGVVPTKRNRRRCSSSVSTCTSGESKAGLSRFKS